MTVLNSSSLVETSGLGASARLIADGEEGWIAHITSRGYVLVKKYPDIPSTAHAPGEGEISIYVDGCDKLIEIQTQGAYAALPLGQSVTWTTTWYVRKLPTRDDRHPEPGAR